MQVNIETPSPLRRKMTIEVEADEIKRGLDEAYNELKRSVRLRGFRPGRAPRSILERYFGDQVRGEVTQRLIRDYMDKALAENELKPVVDPEIVTEESDLSKALKFSAVFDVKPQLEVKDYQDLKIPTQKVEVTDEQVNAALERIRERMAPFKKVEDRKFSRAGDFAIADVQAFDEGKPIERTKLDPRMVRLSKESLPYGLDEVLTGAEVGNAFSSLRTYPPDYEDKDLAGKSVEWRGTIKEIFDRPLANLDDEFAKDQGEFQTLDELRDKIRENLTVQAKEDADAKVRQGLLDLVIERNPFEVPESLIAREQRALEGEIESTLEAAGVPHEQALERAQQGREELKAQAEKRARSGLVLDAISEQEKIEVSDDDVAERIAQIVTRSGRNRDRVWEYYRREEARAVLRRSMLREKTLDLLLRRAQIENPE
jgi:trigger factor